MKAFKIILITMLCLIILGCSEEEAEPEITVTTAIVVDVTATHDHEENRHLFTIDRQEIQPGWVTFQFRNLSDSDHFFMIYKVPAEGIEAARQAGEPLLDHWYQSVTKSFQEEYNPYITGEIDYGTFVENLVGEISEKGPWFFDPGSPPMGGVGFTAINRTARTTVELEPGEYIVECYVKDENEVFHSYIGMLEHITVTGERSTSPEPQADVTITISSENGIETDGTLNAGEQTVEVYFEDQTSYAHLLGHNVQLVKLADKENQAVLNELAAWMDWTQPGGLMNRAPDGSEFIGGAMEMTEGSRAYMHLDLEPGDYAWIAEVPDPASHNMLKTFSVGN
jgi:hypothetical protein